jgi:acetyl-CoA carboxylase biotin carboxylase subunit
MPRLRRILIANRGEIAMRILRACRDEGIEAVTIHSDADAKAMWVREAPQSVRVGAPPVIQSYLNSEAILAAGKDTACDAVHPGYGLLSENANFAQKVVDSGFVWIGPRPDTIASLGVKTRARATMRGADVPVVPGTVEPIAELGVARATANEMGYPVMVKAASGGGGIGMELAADDAALERAMKGVAERAKRFFGGGDVYLEKAIEGARHVEVQVFGDKHGNVAHLHERECSIQRRNQKVVEESPAPLRDVKITERLSQAAVRAARAVRYENAGTVEFLVDPAGNFYFLEMNCRIQVEHPVTEMVTGIDLVREQLRVAAGESLSFLGTQPHKNGWAIQLRLYAEDPDRGFLPSPGPIQEFEIPAGPGVRVDTGFAAGDAVTPYYDPLIAKLVFHGADRAQAIERASAALAGARVGPLKTNIGLHRKILASERFRRGDLSTDFLKILASQSNNS